MKVVDNEDQLQRRASQWTKECEMMLKLHHPNIIRAFAVPSDIVQIAASPFSLLAMEYCPDGDLRKVLSHIFHGIRLSPLGIWLPQFGLGKPVTLFLKN